MYIYVRIYVCVCVCVCMYVCIYITMYIVFVCMNYVGICMYLCMLCICVCMYVCMYGLTGKLEARWEKRSVYMLTSFIEAHTHAQKKIHSFVTFDDDDGMYVCMYVCSVCIYCIVCTVCMYCMYVCMHA